MTQYTFDWENETGIDLKEAGIRTVTSNTPEGYREAFDRVLDELASTGLEFTSEDVTSVVGQPPNHPNAVGAMINGAAKRGVIRKCGYRQAKRPNQHATVIAIWAGKGN
jgi:hypothetical protein